MGEKTTVEVTKEARNLLFYLKKELKVKNYSEVIKKLYALPTINEELYTKLIQIQKKNHLASVDAVIVKLIQIAKQSEIREEL